MCPSWSPKRVHPDPEKKGSGQEVALGESIEQVPKMHKYPLKQVAVLTNRDQKLYRCANRSRSSWTRFDSQQGLMSRWATRNTFVASYLNVYSRFTKARIRMATGGSSSIAARFWGYFFLNLRIFLAHYFFRQCDPLQIKAHLITLIN